MKTSTKTIISFGFYLLSAVGSSMIVKANIGLDCFFAFTKALSTITDIKVGTLVALINFVFVIIYIILSRGKLVHVYIIQVIALVMIGSVINLLVYHVWNLFVLESYILRVAFLICGVLISAISIGVITVLHVITFPIEATCYWLEKLGVVKFIVSRYGIDFVFLIGSLALSYFFKIEFFIREGTLITLIMFSSTVTLTKTFIQKNFDFAIR